MEYVQKLTSSSTPWSVLICQISGSYPKKFFRYFVHKVVPIQNACVRKRGITQPKIYGIRSKVNQFIYTLVCTYMPNIRILAKAVFRYFVHKVVPIQNAYVRKRGITQPKIYGIDSKSNHFIYTLVCTYMPNIRILAKAVLQIFCSQVCSYTKCLCSKKGNNLTENLRNRFKS